MATAPVTVEIEFAVSSTTSNFVLDDPVKGVLDNTTYLLSGVIFVDVSNYVYSVSINRGKNTALGRYNAGTATVVLDNETAIFDPTITTVSSSYPYAGQILPGRRLRISVGTEYQFVGAIQDWDYEYPLGARARAIVAAADSFAELANRSLSAQTFSSATSGAMLGAVLNTNDVGFPTDQRDIETGNTTLSATTVSAGTNALSFAQLIEESEPGNLYVSRNGYLTFRSRRFVSSVDTDIEITDDGTSITPTEIEVEYGSELLYNRASITRTGGTIQTADYTASQDTYGIFAYSADGLLMNSDAVALGLAQYIANTYGAPIYRPRRVTVNMSAQTGSNQGLLAGLDIDDLVRIRFTPPGGQEISRLMTVSGISQQVAPGTHVVEIDLTDAVGTDSMIYGDAAEPSASQPLSLLDSNRYGF